MKVSLVMINVTIRSSAIVIKRRLKPFDIRHLNLINQIYYMIMNQTNELENKALNNISFVLHSQVSNSKTKP